ncbi:hypothetical protein FO519_007986 [Halicephalobus sp. NKZ332]|nr:hypothetical protein FO519_007986 [Halicephalobus sp. NKZ332]
MTTVTPLISGLPVSEQINLIWPIYYCYTIFGILAFLINLIIIFVYFSNQSLKSRFTMYIGLAAADMINGLGFAATGFERLQYQFYSTKFESFPTVNQYQCALQIGNMLQIIGSQWPALIILFLGLERIFAVKYSVKHRHLEPKTFYKVLIISLGLCLISTSVAMYIGVSVQRYTEVPFFCSLNYAYGSEYTTFTYFMTTTCYFAGFLFTIVALIIIIRARKDVEFKNNILSKECRKVKKIIFISLLSLIMIASPNLFLYSTKFIERKVSYLTTGWIHCLFILRSIFNFWVIGFGVKEFEIRFFEMFFPCALSPTDSVSDEESKNKTFRLRPAPQRECYNNDCENYYI